MDKKENISLKTIIKYVVLQIPGLVLVILILLYLQKKYYFPDYILLGIIIIWIVKDIVLFPFVWYAYRSNDGESDHPMVGREGMVHVDTNPEGWVMINGQLWKAIVSDNETTLHKGTPVIVVDANGLYLTVKKNSFLTDE